MPTHHRMESWYPDACPALAVRSSLFMGGPVCRCLHTKAPLWGRATRAGIPAHSSRTIAGPLPFAGPASANRAPLTARLLSLLKNSKNGTMQARPGPLRPLLRAAPEGCGWGLPLQLCGWYFRGNSGAGRRGGGWSGCREKREELKETQAVCEQARAPLAGRSRGEDMLGPGQAHRTGRVYTGTGRCQRSLIHSQLLDCCGSSRAAPPASRG